VRSWAPYVAVVAFIVLCSIWIVSAHAADLPQVNVNAASAGPRQVEDSTQQAIARDYARAWNSMNTALSENRPELLDADFVGVALDTLKEQVAQQQQSGLHTRYIDHGHQLQAVFYSIEGSAIQLRDTANFEVQFLDGDKVLNSQQRTENYTVVMTPGVNRWQVRVLQAIVGQ
jgi:lipase chaperone LimK